jgi:hypothetical protein
VKEAVNRALRSVTGLEPQAEDESASSREARRSYPTATTKIADLELRTVPNTPQDVRDQREATARSTVERIKSLSMECKQLSDCSAQTYEKLTENPELKALESQLQEAKYQEEDNTGAVEAPVSCGKNEVILGATHCPTTDPHYSEQFHGSNSEAPTCTR